MSGFLDGRIDDDDLRVTPSEPLCDQSCRDVERVGLSAEKDPCDCRWNWLCRRPATRNPDREVVRIPDGVLIDEEVSMVSEPEISRMGKLMDWAVP